MTNTLPGSETPQSAGSGADGRSALARRRRWVLFVALGALGLSGAGLVGSTWIKSPADVATETRPPHASEITAPVEKRTLRSTVIFRGSVRPRRSLTFTPARVLSPSGDRGGDSTIVVSRITAKPGSRIVPMRVLVEVSYRPVFALKGDVPAVRDMMEGDRGGDIAQLQRALAVAGFSSGSDQAGEFGSGTAAAVRRLYAEIGYPVPVTERDGGAKPGGEPKTGSSEPAAQPSEPKTRSSEPRSAQPAKKVFVPASEVFFIPHFPATLGGLKARVGEKVEQPLLSVSTGGLRLSAKLDPGEAESVKAGMKAEVLSEIDGLKYTGIVRSVGAVVDPSEQGRGNGGNEKDGGGEPPADGESGPYAPVDIDPEKGSWPPKFTGQNVRVTVTSAATQGAVLAVPQAAMTTAADGRTTVTKVGPDGRHSRIEVVAGMSASGMVQIRPATGDLKPGDQVVVGK